MAIAKAVAAPPLSQRKRLAIQEAGKAVFLQQGYEAASMDAIAAKADVSKQTIYNHFHSKNELFKAIIADMTSALVVPLAISEAANSTPDRILRAFSQELLDLMLKPGSLALHRLIVAEAGRFPELGADLFAAGAAKLIHMLAGYLAWETDRGRLDVPQPERAAELFIGMLSGRVQLRALLGVEKAPSRKELQTRVEHAVSAFMTLYGSSDTGGSVR